ncbi:class I mannose-6-phosphate isomerase [Goodfellowiella coeruleoviolacea]|nr:mannose-6-phosphate isomerase [Goodfellowiella coeruleoviolacea]
MSPLELPPNQPRQFYRGGAAIAALRQLAPGPDEYRPEDWVASTTALFGKDPEGLATLPDGRTLRDAVAADPVGWLGAEHVAAFGADPALLVKLLHAGQRLPVHCHPDNAFAARHLGCRHGKTEAWVVLDTDSDTADTPDPTVYIGLRDGADEDTVRHWVSTQDSEGMLAALNPVRVAAGDTVLVPAGLPHAIGAGVFVVEVQQAADMSVLLEWRDFVPGPDTAHLGLGYATALACVDHTAWPPERIATLLRHTAGDPGPVVDLFGADADPFFRAQRLHPGTGLDLAPSYAVLVALTGTGTLRTGRGETLHLRRGSTVVVPHAAGPTTLTGADLVVVRCQPPPPGPASAAADATRGEGR